MNIETRKSNLIRLIKEAGTQASLSKTIDLDVGYISQMKNGTRPIGEKTARKIEEGLGLYQGWMDQNHDDSGATVSDKLNRNSDKLDNVEFITNTDYLHKKIKNKNKYPLYSYDEVREMMTERSSESLEPHQEKKENTSSIFTMKTTGDAMVAPAGADHTFPKDMVLTVNPNMKTPDDGDFIVAMLKGTEEIRFRQYRVSEETPFLHALNPSNSPIFDDFDIVGTVTDYFLEKKLK